MLAEWGMSLSLDLLDILYSFIGVLPSFSSEVTDVVDRMFEILFSGINLAGIFLDMSLVKILIPCAIAIINADKIIKIVMFILKKIPVLNIK